MDVVWFLAWKTIMANSTATLLRRVKTEAGWRYYPAAYAANGKVKPSVVIVNGQEVKHKTGFYGLRYYEGSHLVFQSLKGSSPAAADAACAKKKAQFSAIIRAKKEGIRVVPIDRERPTLTVQLSQFLTATTARGSMEAGHMLRTLKQQVVAVGLNCGECDGCQKKTRECENWFLHKFRATFCTKLLRSGLDIRTIQSMMGHADLASTMRYLRPAENEHTQARINAVRWT